jgi:hypothetical protein
MENHHGNTYGTEMLSGLLTNNHSVPTMKHLHDVMVKSFDEFRGNTDFPDDVTFLSIRISG